MTSRVPNSAFVTRARSPDTWTGKRANASMNLAKPDPRASPNNHRHDRASPRTKIGAFWCGDAAVATASNHSVNLLTSHVRGTA